jgi:hypothetical protein
MRFVLVHGASHGAWLASVSYQAVANGLWTSPRG